MRIGQGAVPSVDVTDRITRDVGWVADRWLRELRAGRAFGGSVQQIAAAGNAPHTQLINPVGSLITVILYRVYATLSASGLTRLSHYNTALTTNSAIVRNLASGGAAPTGQIRSQDNVAILGSIFFALVNQANALIDFNIKWITELDAGEGVNLTNDAAASTVTTSWFWIEV